jgi:hypothetical protein
MNFDPDNLVSAKRFEEFEYRVVYFRPSDYSAEQIAVGLLADAGARVDARFVSSAAALTLMAQLFGEGGVEQFQFASGELRRSLQRASKVEDVEMPSDLFFAGEPLVAYTADRNGLLASVLASSSALMRPGSSVVVEHVGPADAQIFAQEVMNEVSRLNPFLGGQIFHHRLDMDNGEVLDLPILGNKIFGAPVSFAARDHRMRAEAYVAKFNWARNRVPQEPRVYVRAPGEGPMETSERLERSVRELQAIAEASRVPVRICRSTEELAVAIVRDEEALVAA